MDGPSLSDVLLRPMTGVTRVELEHVRNEQFRPMAILEYALGVTCLLCALPLLVLLFLFSDTDLELPSIRTRFYRRWHELRVTLRNAEGQPLTGVAFVPPDPATGKSMVAAILAAATREQVVVIESITCGGQREIAETWYGGRPLLAHPEEVDEARASHVLAEHDVTVERNPDNVLVYEEARPVSRAQRVFGSLLFVACLPLLLLLAYSPDGRRKLRHAWADVRGKGPPMRTVVEVRAECIRAYHARGEERWDDEVIDGAELLGITFSPSLGFDADVTRSPASLRLIGRRQTATLPLKRAMKAERALRDLLVAATLRLRSANPSLGLAALGASTTRCPFCGASYEMRSGSRCPSCGAHAGQTP